MKLGRIDQYMISGILIMTFIMSSSFLEEKEKLKYMQRSTIPMDDNEGYITAYKVLNSDDSLYLFNSKEDIPIHFFRNIATEVCFDNKCRLLEITIYWNITGRYLGLELPRGEFLSKYDHEPFVPSEYERLNELLADPTLLLGDITFEKLIELPETAIPSVDGISGATTEDLAKVVVKGAAYTTYTLWNIVYGPTIEFVARITENQLSPDLIELILKSPDINDRFWVLNRISQQTVLNPTLTSALLDMISDKNFSLTYATINAISPTHLDSDPFQLGLFSKYEKVNHSVQKMIIDKLMDAPYLHPEIVKTSRDFLDDLNGEQLGNMLLLYSKHSIDDLESCKAIASILQNENRYISKKAYKFLLGVGTRDSLIVANLNAYSK